jgi:hypothetical protein
LLTVPESYKNPLAIAYRAWVNECLSDANITKTKFSIYNGPAIYFLWSGEEIIYIGQARRLMTRLGEHARDKRFDSVSFVSCKVSELCHLESEAIASFRPKLNKTLKSGGFERRHPSLESGC